ncbi:MAG: ABC transporter permease [Candidatus Rokubacteria bacterium]|nr:ABC transporter permease [Candidatus Rokubacteria bacterium]
MARPNELFSQWAGTTRRSSLGYRLRRVWLRHESLRGYALLLPTLLFMIAMMLVAVVTLVILSFWSDTALGAHPHYTLDNYRLLLTPEGQIYRALLLRSLWMSFVMTVTVTLFAYPIAYILAFFVHKHRALWLIVITIPFWINYLLRVFSWKVILGHNGVINSALMGLGLIDAPLDALLYNRSAVIVTLTHAWAAFAILPIYVSLEKIDRSLLEAATDLGDGPLRRFLRVTLPLSMPGLLGATILVFIRNVGDYVTPALVGGISGTMLGNLIVSLFTAMDNGPLAAAVSVVMMLSLTLVVCAFLLLIGGGRRFRVEI